MVQKGVLESIQESFNEKDDYKHRRISSFQISSHLELHQEYINSSIFWGFTYIKSDIQSL